MALSLIARSGMAAAGFAAGCHLSAGCLKAPATILFFRRLDPAGMFASPARAQAVLFDTARDGFKPETVEYKTLFLGKKTKRI